MIGAYKHIIWDWNGTLFNDVSLCVSIVNQLLIARKLPPLSVEKYKEIFTFPVKNYYITAGFNFDHESFEVVGKEWMDEYERRKLECGLAAGATDLLNIIASKKIDQSILSAYAQHTLNDVVETFSLTKYFSYLLGLDNIYASSKVHLGKQLIEKLELEKGEALLLGDTVHDFDVAQEIGADCILLASGHQNRKNLEQCGAPVFDSILDLLHNINGKQQ